MNARIVFDLDGTLIDSAPDICGIANAALATVDAAPITLEDTHSFIGEGIGVFVQKMRAARGLPDHLQEPLLADLVARYDDAVSLTVPYPNVPAALTSLSRTYTLGICTNKLHRPATKVLRHLRLDAFFDTVWGGDNPLGRKPDPAPLRAAFDALGGDGPCLYVGDSEIDAETATRAGVPFLLFTKGYRKRPLDEIAHMASFDDFADLPALVDTILTPVPLSGVPS
ncbi:HAD-IA family hydrolase [uncultured Tateyamaria sp.]|uniref:HAD-IA family hydrolase n=1 Tax=Tateyamaria sp. 1078 TaxID=3417464 RepID=UPI00261C7AE8|nr:HAD-IA family hydrolase [uncultured Tateyamaria sp.]